MDFERIALEALKDYHHWTYRNCPSCDDGAGPCDCDVLSANKKKAEDKMLKAIHLVKYPSAIKGPDSQEFIRQLTDGK